MTLFARIRSLLRNVCAPARIERALDEEMRSCLDLLTDEHLARGLTPEEARRAARLELGGVDQIKEEVRRVRAGALVEQIVGDVRYAFRTLGRARTFTLVAIVTLALGIGVNTAIFSIVDALLFRPLPVADPGRVVGLYRGATGANHAFSYLDYLDYRKSDQLFQGFAAWGGGNPLWLRADGDLERASPQMVSGSYFDVLGVRAALGRLVTPADDDFARPSPVAVLSHAFWTSRFHGDPGIIGRTVTLGGQAFSVVGVASPGFGGLDADAPPDLWLPVSTLSILEPSWNIRDRRELWMSIVARLRQGGDIRAAQLSLQPAAARIGLETQQEAGTVRLVPLTATVSDPDARRSTIRASALVGSIVAVVLLIACANVANLVVARGASRARELGVRLAVGATRGRILRQVITENVVLSVAGGLTGLAVARVTSNLLVALAPAAAIPAGAVIELDGRVVGFAAGLSVFTGVIFGAFPAWQLTRLDFVEAIKSGDRSNRAAGSGGAGLRRVLVVMQVALAVVLLVGASLFVRTLSAARAVPTGYDTGKILLTTIDLSVANSNPSDGLHMAGRVLERVRATPGVESASFGQIVPFSGSLIQRPVVPEGTPATDDDLVGYSVVGDDYFATLGMTLRGRDFAPTDDGAAPRVAIVNESLAAKLWPGENALGRRVQLPLRNPGPPYEVVGVVSDSKYVSVTEAQRPYAYLPLAQNFRPRITLHVRAAGAPAALAPVLRAELRAVSSDLPAYRVVTLDEAVTRSLARERLIARLLTGFSALALAIAAVGIYGMLAVAVARRTPELGIRMALGARPADLIWMIVRQSAAVVGVGLAAGLAGAWALSRLVRTLLFGVTPTDPAAFGFALVILAAAAVVACAVPARRAASLDPLQSLRMD